MPLNIEAAQVTINAKVTGDAAIKKLGGDIRGVQNDARGLQTAFAGAARAGGLIGAAIAGVGTAIFAGTKHALDYADALNDSAKSAGVSAEALQELRYAGVQLGLETTQVDSMLSKLTVTLGKAKIKGDEANTAFRKLSIDPTKMTSTEQAFNTVIDQLKRIPDLATRNALAMEIFGREAGPRLAQLVDQGSEGLNGLREAARKSGAVLSDEFIAKAAESKDKLEAMSMVISAQMTRALVDIAPLLLSTSELFADIARNVGKISFGNFIQEMEKAGIVMRKNAGLPKGFIVEEPELDMLGRVRRKPLSEQIASVSSLDFMQGRKPITVEGKTYQSKTVLPPPDPHGDPKDAQKRAADLEKLLNTYDKEGQALRDLTEAQIKLNAARESMSPEQFSAAMDGIAQAYSDLGAVEEDLTDETNASNAALRDQAQLEDYLGGLYEKNVSLITGLSESTLQYQESVSDLNELHARGKITDDELTAAMERLDAQTQLNAQGFSAFADQAARNMQGIVSGFLRGERAGESFGRSIINMLRDVAAEMAAQAILRQLFGGLAQSANPYVAAIGTAFGGARASGGPVEAGTPYLVGERGPELMVPKQSGTVIANGKLRGSSVVNVTTNLDARNAVPEMLPRLYALLQQSEARTYARVMEATRRAS